ncbi:MAG: polysaccharide deacetylase family protein [Gammaproteobacteria bacterium]
MSDLLQIAIPRGNKRERLYALEVIFTEWLGVTFAVSEHNQKTTRITCVGHAGQLDLPDVLLDAPEAEWRNRIPGTFASMPLSALDGGPGALPALFAVPGVETGIVRRGVEVAIPIDIVGSCFFMLSRYEEFVAPSTAMDHHGRFPASESVMFRQNLLERALLDEYVQLLRRVLNQLWPGVAVVRGRYEVRMTHDVDRPYSTFGQGRTGLTRNIIGDLARRRDPKLAARRVRAYFDRGSQAFALDPNNTFGWMMNVAEAHGMQSTFYFMAAEKTAFDFGYSIASLEMRGLLQAITTRGHEIGIHPSYYSGTREAGVAAEVAQLEHALSAANITEWSRAARQHYLRWEVASTWRRLANAGLRSDSSVGYADSIGFRCGTSRTFSAFDWTTRSILPIKEIPLIAMDVTLSGRRYMNLDHSAVLATMERLARECRKNQAPLTMLWHNDTVVSDQAKNQFKALVEAVSG